MAKKIKSSELAEEVTRLLTTYSDELTVECKKVVDEVSKEVLEETKKHITWKDKTYSKSFALKKSFEDTRNKRNTWYVKSPHYRLTHLLEFGHLTRNGVTRTKAYPHVKYGDEYVENNLYKKMEEAMQKCKI